jgi:hypothetical protein
MLTFPDEGSSRTSGVVMRPLRLAVSISVLAFIGGLVLAIPVTAAAARAERVAAGTAPCTPKITSIGKFQAQASQSVEIKGTCFGTGATLDQSDNFYLQIQDRSTTPAWSACYLEATDGVSCTVSSWTNDEITFNGFNGSYGGDQTLNPGDRLVVAVWNPQTLIGPVIHRARVMGRTSASPQCKPKITSVRTFEPGASQNVDIMGSCLGQNAPFNQSNNVDLYIQDGSTSPTAWSACNGGAVADIVTCTVSSWTNNEIVLTGFGSGYGEGFFVLHPGDQVIVAVWNPQSGVGPGTRLVKVGSG